MFAYGAPNFTAAVSQSMDLGSLPFGSGRVEFPRPTGSSAVYCYRKIDTNMFSGYVHNIYPRSGNMRAQAVV